LADLFGFAVDELRQPDGLPVVDVNFRFRKLWDGRIGIAVTHGDNVTAWAFTEPATDTSGQFLRDVAEELRRLRERAEQGDEWRRRCETAEPR
jgi:hypothetical protein